MATDGPTPAPCDPEIYSEGAIFLILGHWDGGSCAIERWCRMVAVESGQRVDWSFFGGRAVFRVLGSHRAAESAAMAHLGEVGCGSSYQLVNLTKGKR